MIFGIANRAKQHMRRIGCIRVGVIPDDLGRPRIDLYNTVLPEVAVLEFDNIVMVNVVIGRKSQAPVQTAARPVFFEVASMAATVTENFRVQVARGEPAAVGQ